VKTASVRRILKMTEEERTIYMTSAKRVTVGYIEQVVDKRIVRRYVAKIRGVVIGDGNDFAHDTPEQAREYGRDVLRTWKVKTQS
jgi:hypothetical protein